MIFCENIPSSKRPGWPCTWNSVLPSPEQEISPKIVTPSLSDFYYAYRGTKKVLPEECYPKSVSPKSVTPKSVTRKVLPLKVLPEECYPKSVARKVFATFLAEKAGEG